ncbi:hypothetical protein [Lactobacillus kefiranofaciens]|uniref:Uncharacterized protein n=1 Tax=Lactobacillus kefiranofaciens TaxID=267818 RepID=A0AAX3UCY9_9LACO|nr:hypothetical protein [Lactobacillus kefiranofaciens]AEG41125.1 Hypothetical protein WANG_1430 [Lactobacillus kefiranofaciens subsp. kefiranofaciens]WGO85428.1 hypothetical protein QEJ78_08660 [Lactobacillus kefiranofaciens]
MKNKNRFSLFFAIIAFFTLALTGCSTNNSTAKKAAPKQIAVNYTLRKQ